jgi:hypothetical protein
VPSRHLLVCCLLLPALSPANAYASTKRVFSVLEFSASREISVDDRQLLADAARAGAVEVLPKDSFSVTTRENMLTVMRQMGRPCDEEGECEVDTLRTIGADYGVTGRAALLDGLYVVTLKLFDVRTGQLLATAKARATKRSLLLDQVEQATSRMVSQGLKQLSDDDDGETGTVPPPDVAPEAPGIQRGERTTATGSLTVDATPRPTTRLEVTSPAGKTTASGVPFRNPKAITGTWVVTARAPGYADDERRVEVLPDERTSVTISLAKLGSLHVTGTPAGAAVRLSGPAGFHDEGGLPWKGSGLRPGPYRVEVEREGYVTASQDVTVEPGKAAAAKVALVKGTSRPVEDIATRQVLEGSLQYLLPTCPADDDGPGVEIQAFAERRPGGPPALGASRMGPCWGLVSHAANALLYGARFRVDHRARLLSFEGASADVLAEAQDRDANLDGFRDLFPGVLPKTFVPGQLIRYDAKALDSLFKRLYVRPDATVAGLSARRIYDGVFAAWIRSVVKDLVAVLETLAADQLDALARRYERAAGEEGFHGPAWLADQAERVGLAPPQAAPEDEAFSTDPATRRTTVMGVVLRRRIDGTLPVLLEGLKTVLRDYDPDTFASSGTRLKAP